MGGLRAAVSGACAQGPFGSLENEEQQATSPPEVQGGTMTQTEPILQFLIPLLGLFCNIFKKNGLCCEVMFETWGT